MQHLRTYEEAYAHYAPIFQRQWATANVTQATCIRARDDIQQTLALHKACNPYTGKLYAELDAIRDRLMNLRSLSALRAKARRNPARFTSTI
jgi:hypothetical protein